MSIGLIDPDPGQPRREFETAKLLALAESIRAEGIHQPLHVVQVGDRYQIEDGERRWRAAQLAGVDKVPVIVKPRVGWLQTRLHQVLTNALQEPLTPLEDAQALYLLWLGFQVEALEQEQGADEGATAQVLAAAHSPVEQVACLSARLCELAQVETVTAYAGSGLVRVPWQRVLASCGRGDWSPDRRKKHLAVLRVAPEVQAALAGAEVSGRTLRELADLPPAAQARLVGAVQREEAQGGLGAALRAALEREQERQGEAVFRPRATAPDPVHQGGQTAAVSQAHRPVVEPTKEQDAETRSILPRCWSPEAVQQLTAGLDTLLTLCDEVADAALKETDRARLTPLWAELTERLAQAGV